MTVNSTANRNDYVGNDTTAVYAYSYRVFQDTDLKVYVKDDATDIETLLTKTTDYTVAGVGDDGGGNLTLVDAGQAWISASSFLDTGYSLTIRRVLDLKQITDIRNQGDFLPEIHEDQFDKFTMIDQQQQDEIDRSLKLPETVDPATFDAEIPAGIVGEDGVSIITNPAGDGFIVGPTSSEVAGAQAQATAASASAAAAAASAAEFVSVKDSLLDNTSNQELSITIDETVNYALVVEYIVTRGSNIEYGRLLVTDQSPFAVDVIEKVGDAGVTFDVNEVAGVGTVRCTTDADTTGDIRSRIFKPFGV